MSTTRYCDGCDGECNNTNEESPLYEPLDGEVAEALVKRRWVSYKYDIHLCEECIQNYYNETDEQLEIVDDYYFKLGKDWVFIGAQND